MKQPDLGKKIAELRKAKNLTQEELVEKCNLNVRTLQRIESGVVTPRSYTVKTIFAALGCNMNDSLENLNNRFSKTGQVIPNLFEQLYRYVFDLFNLKTNRMKKLTILTTTFIIIGFVLFALCSEGKAKKMNESRSIISKSKFLQSNGRGIIYLFPKDMSLHISNMKDTADYKCGDFLIQEYKQKIFLNNIFAGFTHSGDTVIFDNERLEIRRPYYWEFISPNGKGIVYVTPKNLPIVNYGANKDTDWMVAGNYHIREYNNKIYLDGKYYGIANKGDSVILKKGSFFSKSTLIIKKGIKD